MAKGHIWDRERVLILVAGIGVGLKARFIRAHANNFPYLQTFQVFFLFFTLLHEVVQVDENFLAGFRVEVLGSF